MKKGSSSQAQPLLRFHDIAAWLYIYPLRWLLQLLPARLLGRLADLVGPIYALFRRDMVRAANSSYRQKFENSHLPEPPRQFASQYLRRDLRKAVDDLVMHRVDIGRLASASQIEGLENLDNAISDNNGVIVASGHFHANRMAKFFLRRRGYSLVSVRVPVPYSYGMGQFGNRFVAPAYGRFLSGIIEDEVQLHREDMGMELWKKLRSNAILDMHFDAFIGNNWLVATLLGKQRKFPAGFIHLAELTGAPLVPMFCRGNSSGLTIRFYEPIRYSGQSSEAELVGRFEPFRAVLESWLSDHPEEWEMWSRGKVTN